MSPLSETFCILPWEHLFISVDGVFYPCCNSVDAGLPNVDATGRPHRYSGLASIEEAWNSEYMMALRAAMLKGQRPAPCRGCYMLEDLNTHSPRQKLNHKWASFIQPIVDQASHDGHAPLNFRTLDLRLGNTCNLKCRMCSPRVSAALQTEFNAIYGRRGGAGYPKGVPNGDWIDGKELGSVLEHFAPGIEELHFAGGEPFLIPAMYDILERLIAAGRADKIKLSYITNLSTLPSKLCELWPRFNGVRVAASIDGHDRVNSYIRYPSDWTHFCRNLDRIDKEAEQLNCTELKFYTTVQIYNAFSLPLLFEYIFNNFRHFEPFPNLILLTEPSCLSVQTLPLTLKADVTSRLRAFVSRTETQWLGRASAMACQSFSRHIEAAIQYMHSVDQSHQLSQFVRRTKLHDAYRRQDAGEIIPELRGLLVEQGGDAY